MAANYPPLNDSPIAQATQPGLSMQHADTTESADNTNAAVNLIRAKLDRLYLDEPDAGQEMSQTTAQASQYAGDYEEQSIHQQFMGNLSQSGKSLTQIQTEWHSYYTNLPDIEKHAVWQEFYSNSAQSRQAIRQESAATSGFGSSQPRVPANVYPTPTNTISPASYRQPALATASEDSRQPFEIKQHLLKTVDRRTKLKPRHHIQSLLFGLGCGGLALLVVLFSFFNEIVIAPFLQPSRTVSATPIIIGADGVASTDKAEVIIPKINVQIPLEFSAKSIREGDIQKALESGVVHYPTTAMPGQQGNAAFFGHSSNNIFNPGKYKFAFVLLNELVTGDTFYLTRDSVAYAYTVIDKKVVEPTEISILDAIPGKTATATLITCDPPGTTLKRLAVIGEQISPNPSGNVAAEIPAIPTASSPEPGSPATSAGSGQSLPGEAPSLWQRLTGWFR